MTHRQDDILRLLQYRGIGFMDFSDADWPQVVAMGRVGWVWWDENQLIRITARGRDVLDGMGGEVATKPRSEQGLHEPQMSDAAE